ncbi:MAG: ParA family protein [bacterium]
MAKRISIINFKGGVGKTTLAFHLATGLERFHDARVLLVDMDHQSSLSIVCMGAEQWANAAREKSTIDKVFQPFVSATTELPGDEIITKSPVSERMYSNRKNLYPNLDLVPASLDLDDTEIKLTASHRGDSIKSDWDKLTNICRWIEETGIDDKYDYIIFDCPPATKIVAQNAIAASHGYIVPVVPEAVMMRGAPHLYDMMQSGIDARLIKLANSIDASHRSIHVQHTRLIGLVVTRIQSAASDSGYTNDHTAHLELLKRRWEENLLPPYIPQSTGLSQSLAFDLPVYDCTSNRNVKRHQFDKLFKKLTSELKQRIDDA